MTLSNTPEKAVGPVRFAVRIWGIDKFGKPFSQTVQAVNVRSTGAIINGVHAALKSGDVIGLQSGNKKGRFRVVSAGDAGTPHAGEVELEGVELEDKFWVIPMAEKKSERRAHKRYEVSGTAVICAEGSNQVFEATVTDISLKGCYVQNYSPLPIGTALTIDVSLLGHSAHAQGVVRTCHPYMGMGIQFKGEPDTTLRSLIAQFTERTPAANRAAPVAKADVSYTTSRLQSISDELGHIDQLIQCTDLNPIVLRQFRTALGDVRNTAWAIECYIQSHAASASATSQLEFLAYERIRLVTQLCRSLTQDIGALSIAPEHLQPLVTEVVDLVKSVKSAAAGAKK